MINYPYNRWFGTFEVQGINSISDGLERYCQAILVKTFMLNSPLELIDNKAVRKFKNLDVRWWWGQLYIRNFRYEFSQDLQECFTPGHQNQICAKEGPGMQNGTYLLQTINFV